MLDRSPHYAPRKSQVVPTVQESVAASRKRSRTQQRKLKRSKSFKNKKLKKLKARREEGGQLPAAGPVATRCHNKGVHDGREKKHTDEWAGHSRSAHAV